MCIATAAILAGTALSAGTAVAGGIAQGQAASYQAAVARNNAIIAQQQASYSAKAGAAQTEAAGLRAGERSAAVTTGIAAEGLDVSSGSPADVRKSQRGLGFLDVSNTNYNAALREYGFQTEAGGFNAQSSIYSAEAANAPIEGFLKGGASLLSAAPSLPGVSSWMGGNPSTDSNGDPLAAPATLDTSMVGPGGEINLPPGAFGAG